MQLKVKYSYNLLAIKPELLSLCTSDDQTLCPYLNLLECSIGRETKEGEDAKGGGM